MAKNNYRFYNFARVIVKYLGKLYFGGIIKGRENIPKNGRCILAGNHVSNFDVYLVMSSTKRPVHFLAKKELLDTKFKNIFSKMHIIPVNRKEKNPEAIKEAISLLNNDKVVGIFPEGTFHKENLLLPFKPGVIKLASESASPIIPFVIKGNFKFRSKPVIEFGKPIYLDKIKNEDKLKYLEDLILQMLKK